MKQFLIFTFSIFTFLLFAFPASAHVVVSPHEVPAGAFQTFTIGVPNEKDNPTIFVKLLIPSGLMHVTPNVKPGWNIETKKSSDNVTEIIWSGGSIPAEQRDEFMFSAQAPADPTTLEWKAYQMYEDGTTVSWDQKSEADHMGKDDDKEDSKTGPASTTNVINPQNSAVAPAPVSSKKLYITMALSVAALALSVIAFGKSFKKK